MRPEPKGWLPKMKKQQVIDTGAAASAAGVDWRSLPDGGKARTS